MISEEERKAINDLNFIIVTDIYDNEVSIDKTKVINEYNHSLGVVLDLVRTQNKMIDKLETKLMYALTPTNHELALDTQSNFKRIIRENIEDDTYTIRKKLKEYWENPDYWKK